MLRQFSKLSSLVPGDRKPKPISCLLGRLYNFRLPTFHLVAKEKGEKKPISYILKFPITYIQYIYKCTECR